MDKKDFKIAKNRGFSNPSELDIFNGVTSLTELNNERRYEKQMPKKIDDFTDEDLVRVSMDFWKFKEIKEIQGTFSRWENDNFGQHAVLIVDGNELHLPNLMALNGKLKTGRGGNSVAQGNRVKIVYSGQTKAKSGRLYEDFQVFIKQ